MAVGCSAGVAGSADDGSAGVSGEDVSGAGDSALDDTAPVGVASTGNIVLLSGVLSDFLSMSLLNFILIIAQLAREWYNNSYG